MTQKRTASKLRLSSIQLYMRGIISGIVCDWEGGRRMNNAVVVKGQGRALTAAEFVKLAEVPPEVEWFANLRNPNTRKAYENDLREFRRIVGIERPDECRTVSPAPM